MRVPRPGSRSSRLLGLCSSVGAVAAATLSCSAGSARAAGTPEGAVVHVGPDGLLGPITQGPDGAMWYLGTRSIGRITPTHSGKRFPVGGKDTVLRDIAAGPDRNLWFTDSGQAAIGRLTPSGAGTEFAVPGQAVPSRIVAGRDGNLWFTEPQAGAIGRISPGGQFTVFPVNVLPAAIAAGPDGNTWFTEFGAEAAVWRMTPKGALTRFLRPGIDVLNGIVAGSDGNLWFTEGVIGGPSRIARITPTGAVTEFTLPTEASPQWIAAGPDGNLWFTDAGTGVLGRVTPTGTFTQLPLPVCGVLGDGVAAGPANTVWFTSSFLNDVGWSPAAGPPRPCHPYVARCRGKARRAGPARVNFHFRCSTLVVSFTISASRPLSAVSDAPRSVFECSRAGPRSGRCGEIHATGVSFGEGHVITQRPCRPGGRLVLRVTARLDSTLAHVPLRPLRLRLSARC